LDNLFDSPTLWEVWDYSDNTFSHNHPMFGGVDEWFYKYVAGIKQTETSVAFDDIIINPFIAAEVSWVKSSYFSSRGLIESSWEHYSDGRFCQNVTIPVNTKATILLPDFPGQNVGPYHVGSGKYTYCVGNDLSLANVI